MKILATDGTAERLQAEGISCSKINKISQGRPHILDKLQDKEVDWIINTSYGKRTTEDSYSIRRTALELHIPYTTTVSGAGATVRALEETRRNEIGVKPVQQFTR